MKQFVPNSGNRSIRRVTRAVARAVNVRREASGDSTRRTDMQNIRDFNRERRTFFWAQTTNNLGLFLLVLLGGARDEREEGETFLGG